ITETGLLINFDFMKMYYLGVGHGLVESTVKLSGAGTGQSKYKGSNSFLVGGMYYEVSDYLRFFVEGQYIISGEYSKLDGADLATPLKFKGFSGSIGIGFYF
ncbi:hypothetical protein N9W41_01500, partial [bacterium]|nr:hypothetical protein [bacterium]